ncbi:MAG: metallophosphoesterase [Thermoanaerobaculia bacterium]|nr:metallophosphoesterase [Thermoanaerobaculia bacterium]
MSHRVPEDAARRSRRHLDAQAIDKLTAHRGKATWGEKLVPLDEFRDAALQYGRSLDEAERKGAVSRYLSTASDGIEVEGPYQRIAVFGGIYNNSYGLEAVLEDAQRRGAEAVYCLGDFGGFGPNPEKIWPLLEQGEIGCIQGNYEQSLSSGAVDCNCGYADPRDNHFAAISYRYTAKNASEAFKRWMGGHPLRRRVRVGEKELLLVHGSPRRINEFLFASQTPTAYLEVLLDQEGADAVLCTHTGLQWHRRLPSGRDVVNVGVIGRPANDGQTHVWYSMLHAGSEGDLQVELLPLPYDHESLAADMRREDLPEEFVQTILTGWWTTCLEILPARERAASRF